MNEAMSRRKDAWKELVERVLSRMRKGIKEEGKKKEKERVYRYKYRYIGIKALRIKKAVLKAMRDNM